MVHFNYSTGLWVGRFINYEKSSSDKHEEFLEGELVCTKFSMVCTTGIALSWYYQYTGPKSKVEALLMCV